MGPGHQLVDTGGGPEVDQFGQGVGEPSVRVHAVKLTGFTLDATKVWPRARGSIASNAAGSRSGLQVCIR